MQIEANLRPLQFRPFADADTDRCLEIWRANESRFFPAGHEPLFTEALRQKDAGLYLLGELEGEIVCGGGIDYRKSCDAAHLSFGMVDPRRHRSGFGTTLLLARLALLDPPPEAGCVVHMEVTPHSYHFYQRFGFQGYDAHVDEHGNHFASLRRLIYRSDVDRCRADLSRFGASFAGAGEIPLPASKER